MSVWGPGGEAIDLEKHLASEIIPKVLGLPNHRQDNRKIAIRWSDTVGNKCPLPSLYNSRAARYRKRWDPRYQPGHHTDSSRRIVDYLGPLVDA